MTATTNRRIVLVSHPKGKPTAENFRIEDAPIPTPGDGELLLETLFLSLDPYMRTRMNGTATYAAALELGDVMVGGTVARVKQSNHPDWKEGDIVVLDNLGSHRGAGVRSLIRAAGARVLFGAL